MDQVVIKTFGNFFKIESSPNIEKPFSFKSKSVETFLKNRRKPVFYLLQCILVRFISHACT